MFDALAVFAVARRQFGGALLQFAEQPRILDRDDRLVGKGAHQFDLPLGEQLDPLPREIDRADHGSFAQQRHPKVRLSPGRYSFGQSRSSGQRRCPRHARPCLRAPPARPCCRDRAQCSLAQLSPKTRASLHCRTRHIAVDLALAYRDISASAPQSRTAVSTTVSSTGCTSEVERLMTLSTSLVAVWYSSNSWRSPRALPAIPDRSRRW